MTVPARSPYPDAKTLLVQLLGELVETNTRVPAGYDGKSPRLRVRVLGGSDNGVTDFPTFDVDALSGTETDADDLAETVRQFLTSGPHTTTLGVLDRVRVINRPQTVPYSDTIFNTTASYRGALRRP